MKHIDEDEEAEFEVKHRGDRSQTVDPMWLCVCFWFKNRINNTEARSMNRRVIEGVLWLRD